MKIRYGFVTNSSSSSFVLVFHSKSTMDKELREANPQFSDKYLDILSEDLHCSSPSSYYDIIEYAKKYYKFIAELDVENDISSLHKMSHNEFLEWKKENEQLYNELVRDRINTNVLNISFGLGGKDTNDYIVRVDYSDNDGPDMSTMEHHVLPYIAQTVVVFNNH